MQAQNRYDLKKIGRSKDETQERKETRQGASIAEGTNVNRNQNLNPEVLPVSVWSRPENRPDSRDDGLLHSSDRDVASSSSARAVKKAEERLRGLTRCTVVPTTP